MREVYLAEDQQLKREVALKLLPCELSGDQKALERFHREARAAAALHHPNVCMIHEIGEAEGRSFIAMEFCNGKTLQHHLASGPMSTDEALEIAIQVADALQKKWNTSLKRFQARSPRSLVRWKDSIQRCRPASRKWSKFRAILQRLPMLTRQTR